MSENSSAYYYTENKKRLQKKKAYEMYQDLSEEEKNKPQHDGKQCKNFPEDEKQRLVEY